MTSNRVSILLAIVAMIGAPAVFTASYRATSDIGSSLLFTVLYSLIVALVGIASRIMKKFEDQIVEDLYEKINVAVAHGFSNYYQLYRQYMREEYRNVDLAGLSVQGEFNLQIEKIFVELSILPQSAGNTSSTIVPQHKTSERKIIWDYIKSNNLTNIAIIGFPGSGKTTLLKYITLVFFDRKQRGRYSVPKYFPILLILRNHVVDITEDAEYSLIDAIKNGLKRSGPVPPTGWLEHKLERGDCVIMFDGLDEVATSAQRLEVVDWVDAQMVKYSKGNRFILTSRPGGYIHNPSKQIDAVLEVSPFTIEQQQVFIKNWYRQEEVKREGGRDDAGVIRTANLGASDLIHRIRKSPSLSILAKNPLLLTMITCVHRNRGVLPEKRVRLYAEICEVFLGRSLEARRVQLDLEPAQSQRVLQPLAFHMMTNHDIEIPLTEAMQVIKPHLELVTGDQSLGSEFFSMIELRSGLMVEREQGVLAFAHKTFQEYMAAIHIIEQDLESTLIRVLSSDIEDEWWHETIRLYCGRSDATNIIDVCLSKTPLTISSLTLALECLQEAREVKPRIRTQIERLLEGDFEATSQDERRIISEAKLELDLRKEINIGENKFVLQKHISNTHYELFLESCRQRGVHCQPDHWLTETYAEGQANLPIMGIRQSDAHDFCTWLTERDPANFWLYRLPMQAEIDLVSNALTNPEILYWVVDEDYTKHKGFLDVEATTRLLKKHLIQIAQELVSKVDPLIRDVTKLNDQQSSWVRARTRIIDFCETVRGDNNSKDGSNLSIIQNLASQIIDCLFEYPSYSKDIETFPIVNYSNQIVELSKSNDNLADLLSKNCAYLATIDTLLLANEYSVLVRDIKLSNFQKKLHRFKLRNWTQWYIAYLENSYEKGSNLFFRRGRDEIVFLRQDMQTVLNMLDRLESRITGREEPIEGLVIIKEASEHKID